jgi:hypothetical protein
LQKRCWQYCHTLDYVSTINWSWKKVPLCTFAQGVPTNEFKF